MALLNYKRSVISTLNNSEKKGLPILILKIKILILNIKKVNITMINADAYWIAWKLKKAQVFTASIRNLEYQAKKEARTETKPKIIIPEDYHNLLNVFS